MDKGNLLREKPYGGHCKTLTFFRRSSVRAFWKGTFDETQNKTSL
jgi:hypothetical protein